MLAIQKDCEAAVVIQLGFTHPGRNDNARCTVTGKTPHLLCPMCQAKDPWGIHTWL